MANETNEVNLGELVPLLSSERLRPYRDSTHDLPGAIKLYEWNTSVSGAMYEVLAGLEVILRNALVAQLENWHGQRPGSWYRDPRRVLAPERHIQIVQARERVRQLGRDETPGRVVAELSFGFWRYLLTKRYESSLWTHHLRHAFPHLQPQSRARVEKRIRHLNRLRNRVAHHEPIHNRDLNRDHQDIITLIGWISTDAGRWVAAQSRVPALLRARQLPS
ncbi:Abi family protein [Phytoactinopolyspora limicola]|uniref:Abi family protein n=1 Tax=Phytoactinopolyspora limicola TaxID=2715536 RepID=UPI00140884B6|nr:Abi family protein [Phytoactinopolyspora limicola]